MRERAILTLDIASTMGWAYGEPGAVPRAGTVRFAPPASANGVVGCGAMRWLSDFMKLNRVGAVYYEAPFDPRVMGNKTNFKTTRMLVGLPFLFDTLLEAKGISRVREVAVADARKHFLGRGVKGDEGKKLVQARCRQLGWSFDSPDAADALAVWSFACTAEEPKTGIATTPLFQPRAGARPVAEDLPPFAYDEIEDIPS